MTERRQRATVVVLLMMLTWSASVDPCHAQSRDDLQSLQRTLDQSKARAKELQKKAEQAAAESRTVSQRLVNKAADVRALENTLSSLKRRVDDLTHRTAAQKTAIVSQNRSLATTLAALQRLSQHPPEILLLKPEEATQTIRTASLLALALPAIRDKTQHLKAELDELNKLRLALLTAREEQTRSLTMLRTEEQALTRLQREKQERHRELANSLKTENERLAKLAREAKNLEALLERIERERPLEEGGAFKPSALATGMSFAKARGALPFPATGRVVQRFGDKTPSGSAKGITLEVSGGAPVLAPFDGQIIFAGPFRSYGLLLIIAHGGGYHSLLAGMSRIAGAVGQWVLTGEPVGVMPETRVASGEGAAVRAPLYLEFRKNGAPFNPLLWLKK